jgi:mycothiol synthase
VHAIDVKRRMGEEDIGAVAALLRAAEQADGHAPLGEHKWIDLVEGGRAGFAGFVARACGSDRLIGYAQLSRGPTSWAVEYVVHPTARGSRRHVAGDLLAAALDEVAREGGGHVHLWVPRPGPLDDEIAAEAGLSRGRTLYQMRRRLPLEPDLGRLERPRVRAFRVGQDERAWLELNARVFSDHPEQGSWSADTLADRERQAWFDPAGFLLHEGEAGLDAFCWTKVHDADPSFGEVYVLGVEPSQHGRGLGRGVLLAGLDHLEQLGLGLVTLYVDAESVGAVHLYRATGFSVDHADQAYVGDVAAAPRAQVR